MSHFLEGKVAIVTGASSGIGKETGIALAKAGVKVVLAARRKERLENIKEKMEGECLAVQTNVTKRSDLEDLVKRTIEKFGKVDILINNAGVLLPSYMDKLHVDEWEQMVDVNLKGVLYSIAAVLPEMKARGSGHIINIASRAGHRVIPARAVYSATKFAVRALSEGLRQELSSSSKIRVSVISPGIVDTEVFNYVTDSDVKKSLQERNLKTLTSNDIANSILYAVSQPEHVNVNEILVLPTEQT